MGGLIDPATPGIRLAAEGVSSLVTWASWHECRSVQVVASAHETLASVGWSRRLLG